MVASLIHLADSILLFLCRYIEDFKDNDGVLATTPLQTKMRHRYLAPVDVGISIEPIGTEVHRLLVMCITYVTDTLALMVCDGERGKISYASSAVADMLGYPAKTLIRMDMTSLIQEPYDTLHAKWLKVML